MRRTRTGLWPLLGAVVLLSGCFSAQSVRKEPLQRLRDRDEATRPEVVLHDDPSRERTWLALGEGAVRLEPRSRVRLRRMDGTWTPAFEARHLRVGAEGLFIAVRPLKWDEVAVVEVRSASTALLEALHATAPAGAVVEPTDLGLRLRPGPGVLRAWLGAALALPDGGDLAPGTRETALFTLHPRSVGALPELDAGELAQALEQGLLAADGIRWADLEGAEVTNLSGARTWLAVVAGLATAPVGGFIYTLVMPESSRPAQAFEVTAASPRLVASPTLTPPRHDDPVARPVFGERELRRARWRPYASGAFGSHLHEPARLHAALGGGVRLRDLYELGLEVSPYWHAPNAPGGTLPGGPLSPGRSARLPSTVVAARAGLHLEVDAARRFALPLAVSAGAAFSDEGAVQLRGRYGARVRPFGRLWVGLHPLNPVWTSGLGWGFPSSLELLYEY